MTEIPNQFSGSGTPDQVLATCLARIGTPGGPTLRELAAELGLTRAALKGRIEHYRRRIGIPPQSAFTSEPIGAAAQDYAEAGTLQPLSPRPGEVLFPDLRVRGDEELFAEDYLDAVIRLQALESAQDNEQDVAHAEIADTLPCMVVFTGDWHAGNRYTDHALLRQHLEAIRSAAGVYVIGMGDYADHFVGSLARVGIHEQVIKPKQQRAIARRLVLDKLGGREKTLALLAGNHCFKPEELTGEDPVADMAAEAGVPYLGYGGVLYVKLGSVEYKFGLWHSYPGWSSINPGNNNRRIRADYEGLDADCLGHYHVNYGQTGTTKEGRDYVDLRSGTMLLWHPRYGAQRTGAKAGDSRMPGLIIWPGLTDAGRKRMQAFRDFHDGLEFLAFLRRG